MPTKPQTFHKGISGAGIVTWAQFAPVPDFAKKQKRVTGKRREGLVYEAKAHEYVEGLVFEKDGFKNEITYIKSPWLVYRYHGDPNHLIRFCQPDGLIVDLVNKTVTIVEYKLKHTAEAWKQVRGMYEPVLQKIYPTFTFFALEITKWLDPQSPFPETFKYSEDIFNLEKSRFCVHIFTTKEMSLKKKGAKANGHAH